jgi:cytidylate kinase
MKHQALIPIESRLEGGWIGGSEIYKLKHTLQAGVSVRIKSESKREGKQINQEIKWMNTVICFTEVRFQRT